MRGGGWLVLVGLLGLGVYAGLQQWPQIQARFGLSPSETLPAGAPAPAVVYRWKDAQGNVHFGDRPDGPGAKRVELAPLNTMKGMSRTEVDSALKPAQATAAQDDACPPEDAQCLRRKTAPRNLALERMEAAVPR